MTEGNADIPKGPVVILGLPRSYSTLTCAMIGCHPAMYGMLEMQFLKLDTMSQWWRLFGGSQHEGDGLRRVVAEVFFGGQTWECVERAKRWLWERRGWSTMEVYREISRRCEPAALVFKSLITGIHGTTIRRKLKTRLDLFPQARWIHLVRHPLAYGRSHIEYVRTLARTRHRPRLARPAPMLDRSSKPAVVDPQLLWYRVHSDISKVLLEIPAERRLLLRGEDLLTTTRCALTTIANWLGIAADEASIDAMTHPERSPFAHFGPRNARLGGDPKFFRNPQLRVEVAVRDSLAGALPWRPDGRGFSANVIRLAREFGYE